MPKDRPLPPDFQALLERKPKAVVDLFCDARRFVLELLPGCNELLYHTHALTAVFSTTDKLTDAFCMLPIYTNHVNLGFNKGTLLSDPQGLLTGTGNLIRHIDIHEPNDYRNPRVTALIQQAAAFAAPDKASKTVGQTISKIKASTPDPLGKRKTRSRSSC